MIIHPAPQNTPEWARARAGIVTASVMDQIIQPKKREPSKSQGRLLSRLLAEWALGRPLEEASSSFMQRGHEEEPQAAKWYAFDRDADLREVGLCLMDNGLVGASPDRLVGEDGVWECKTLSAENHVAALLGEKDDEHFVQIQGQMWVCERAWADLCFWNPVLPPVVVRVERDEAFIGALHECIEGFLKKLEAGRSRLRDLGVEPPADPVEPDYPNDAPTPEQVAEFNRILARGREPVPERKQTPDLDVSDLAF